jgi:hypothetical protein
LRTTGSIELAAKNTKIIGKFQSLTLIPICMW